MDLHAWIGTKKLSLARMRKDQPWVVLHFSGVLPISIISMDMNQCRPLDVSVKPKEAVDAKRESAKENGLNLKCPVLVGYKREPDSRPSPRVPPRLGRDERHRQISSLIAA